MTTTTPRTDRDFPEGALHLRTTDEFMARIRQQERNLAARDAELAAMKAEQVRWGAEVHAIAQGQIIAAMQETAEWKRKAEEAARDAKKLTLDAVEQRLLNWRQRTMNKSGDRLALDDFMGKESIDDLIDYVCDEYAAIAAKGD